MTPTIERLLDEIDHLPEPDKRLLASEVLRRFLEFDSPSLTDEDLIQIVEERFLDLEREESER
jgi:hypothetical protein